MAKKKKLNKIKESIGLDIGTHSIKLVHLKHVHDGFKLVNFAIRSTIPEGLEHNQSDLMNDRYAPVLTGMLRSLKINPKKVKHLVTSVGGDNTSIKQIKTIFLPDDELESALFFEAKKHLPISGSEMVLDYQVLNVEEKTNNMNILLASTTRALLKEHTQILGSGGLQPNVVDLEPLAVANSFALTTLDEDGLYVLLNVGAYKTNMVVYSNKSKFFTRDISWGGYHYSKDLAKIHKCSFEEAEKMKLELGLAAQKTNASKESLLALDITEKTAIEQIALEVKRSLRFYVKEAGDSDFRKILLVGGTAKLKGLPEYFSEQLNIPTEIFNPMTEIDGADRFSDALDPQLALALGLAMRPE
ncbi:MAG: pilus assembly protein PilM [Candidatus Cloacimonetes bacterium]|nr:pilus assembly protein PilM [Candidatus Cloacimonadota bacterium]